MKLRTMILMLLLASPALAGDEEYKLGPDSMRQEGVPQGTVTKDVWHSKVFPNTVRDYWVYVPKQYDGSKPACVMVFQDGQGYVKEDGDFRVPVVFDNLIHKGEMPATIGTFINPGLLVDPSSKEPGKGSNSSSTTTSSWAAPASTAASMAGRSCRIRYAGCGARLSRRRMRSSPTP